MRAMLRALKIEAYPIAIYSGDPTFVRAEWVSPSQFKPLHHRRQSQRRHQNGYRNQSSETRTAFNF